MASLNMQSTNEIYVLKAFVRDIYMGFYLWYFRDFFFFFILTAHVLSLYVKDQRQPPCFHRGKKIIVLKLHKDK